MKQLDLAQGSPEWHAHRASHFNASDAPAMLGCSPYKSRAQLLHELHTGISAEVDAGTQRRFDDGHRFEALARPLAEKIIGEDLYPVVGVEGELSASFDGLTMLEDVVFEHKTLSEELRTVLSADGCTGADLPKHYRVQMEQQLLIAGAQRALFMASKWGAQGLIEAHHCWYEPDPALRAEIVAGWRQFAADLAAYIPSHVVPAAVAAPMESLPAVAVRVDGSLVVASNLDKFRDALEAFIAKIPKRPETDQDFADTDAACKALKRAEEALKGAEASALAQIASVEELTRTVANLIKLASSTRLASEKLVAARKEQIRSDEVQRGRLSLAAHIEGLNARIGRPLMPQVPCDFGAAIRGKKTIQSLRDGIDTELARAKIAASEIADRIESNWKRLPAEHAFLFADLGQLVLKAPEDFDAVVVSRIAQHQEAVAKRMKAARQAEAEAQRLIGQTSSRLIDVDGDAPATLDAPRCAAPLLAAKIAAATPSLKLGTISDRLGFTVTAEFLARLGFQPAAIDKNAKLFHEADFARMCSALTGHIQRVRSQYPSTMEV
jgi:putative phage-type endonuclease